MKVEFASNFEITLPANWTQVSQAENFPKPIVFAPPGAADWSVVIGFHVTPADPELLSKLLEKPELLSGSRRSKEWREVGNIYGIRDADFSTLVGEPAIDLIDGKEVLVLKFRLQADPDSGLKESYLHLVVGLSGSHKVQVFLLAEISKYSRYLATFINCLESMRWRKASKA